MSFCTDEGSIHCHIEHVGNEIRYPGPATASPPRVHDNLLSLPQINAEIVGSPQVLAPPNCPQTRCLWRLVQPQSCHLQTSLCDCSGTLQSNHM